MELMPLSTIENQLTRTLLVKETEQESRQPSPAFTTTTCAAADDMSISPSSSFAYFLKGENKRATSSPSSLSLSLPSCENQNYSRRLSSPARLQHPFSQEVYTGVDQATNDSRTTTVTTRTTDKQQQQQQQQEPTKDSRNCINNQSCDSSITRSHRPNSSHSKHVKNTFSSSCRPSPPLIGNSITGSHRGLPSGNDESYRPSSTLSSLSHGIDVSLLQSQFDDDPLILTPPNHNHKNDDNNTICSSSSTFCSTSSTSTTNSGATASFNPALINTSAVVYSNTSFDNHNIHDSWDHHHHHQEEEVQVPVPVPTQEPSCRSNRLEIPDLEILAIPTNQRNSTVSCFPANHQLCQGQQQQQQQQRSCLSSHLHHTSNMVNSIHSSTCFHHQNSLGLGTEQPAPQAKPQDKTPIASNKVLSQSSSFYMMQQSQPQKQQSSMVSSPWHTVAATSVVASPMRGGRDLPPHSQQQQQQQQQTLSLHRPNAQQVQYFHPEESSIVEQRQEPSPFSSPSSSSATLVVPPSFMAGHLAGPLAHYRAAAAGGAGTAVGSSTMYPQQGQSQKAHASLAAPTSTMSYAAKMQMSMPISLNPSSHNIPPPPPPPPPRSQYQYNAAAGTGKSTVGVRSRSGSNASGLSIPSPEHRGSAGPRIPLSPKNSSSNSITRSNWQQQQQLSSNAINGSQSSSSMSFRNHLHSSTKQHMVPNSPGHHSRTHHHASSSSSRPSPEVLKTLLRKKACLYEPGTSRAIALITWLVGRNLALTLGYFSRQRLQAGVHAVVANKIDSGMITRTKVNRCMQIILNSCFHYIIPRPDGMEENGEAFRQSFAQTVEDDTHLLKSLPAPWDDLDITVVENMIFCDEEEDDEPEHHREEAKKSKDVVGGGISSSSSNTAGKKGSKKDAKLKHGSGKYEAEDEDVSTTQHDSSSSVQSKRLVLLCFNENVRSAEDVLRCHNDFIRDAAISSNLFLTSEEWRYFFSRKDDDGSQTSATVDSTTSSNAAMYSSPMIKGIEGCDIPYLSFDIPAEVTDCLAFNDSISEPWGKSADILGQMNSNELAKFRTTWCCKRYEHDVKLCRFAHVTENKGWLRRDPTVYHYTDQLCPQTAIVKSDDSTLNGCHINACKDGLYCRFAHSQEEVDYHPRRYKSKVCESCKGGIGSSICRPCLLLDICPNSHPNQPGHNRLNRRRGDSFSRGKPSLKLNTINDTDVGDQNSTPGGSPIIYLTPAPISDFDKAFQFAGLQSLFRRNCTVHYASHCGMKGMKYTLFNNDCGMTDPLFRPGRGNNGSFSLYSD
eukprot:CAMPEP_0176504868 /NCGR_PEP_ID=MMETSP0200_2-20121128/16182_1 /TAXON_ID=947934 /ORGANISM="Chaetoceros sp., Strain GSL56" /LENGTH=1285 /DNA_ID=CAMNT_0017904367 /DNA_START=769 /DNA_END=4626 /DNA_ORIENTATION=-